MASVQNLFQYADIDDNNEACIINKGSPLIPKVIPRQILTFVFGNERK